MNEELSPREHDEVRANVLAGVHRIKPVGAHRMQLIAASVALVLVVGVTGGAFAAASLFGSAEIPPVSTPTPTVSATPSPTPTPTPTPTQEPVAPVVPATGIQAFGGDCANALNAVDLAEIVGADAVLVEPRWRDGSEGLQGGIRCWWTEVGGENARVIMIAYPADSVPPEMRTASTSCAGGTDGCTIVGDSGSTWLSLSTVPSFADEDQTRALWDRLASRTQSYPAPQEAPRTAEWWAPTTCEYVDAVADIAARTGLVEAEMPVGEPDLTSPSRLPFLLGGVVQCGATTHSPDGGAFLNAFISVVPGGGAYFDQIASSEGAEFVDIDGAVAAVSVSDSEPWEGYYSSVVVTDGVNLITVGAYWDGPVEDPRAAIAGALLAAMNG